MTHLTYSAFAFSWSLFHPKPNTQDCVRAAAPFGTPRLLSSTAPRGARSVKVCRLEPASGLSSVSRPCPGQRTACAILPRKESQPPTGERHTVPRADGKGLVRRNGTSGTGGTIRTSGTRSCPSCKSCLKPLPLLHILPISATNNDRLSSLQFYTSTRPNNRQAPFSTQVSDP